MGHSSSCDAQRIVDNSGLGGYHRVRRVDCAGTGVRVRS